MTDAERIDTLKELGYTKREAAFLSLTALHSGYFLRRQYQAFAGYRGQVEERFLVRAESLGHIRSAVYANRTEVYHVFPRALYRAIGEEDNRHRRPRPNFSIKANLMALDFVLTHRGLQFLATESEKLDYFCRLPSIDRTMLPRKDFLVRSIVRADATLLHREIPDLPKEGRRCGPASRVVLLRRRGSPLGLGIHEFPQALQPTLRFSRTISTRLRCRGAQAVPKGRACLWPMRGTSGEPRYARAERRHGEYFRLRRLLEARQYGQLNKAKLDRLRDLSERFRRSATESRFQQWANAVAAHKLFGPVDAGFEAYGLPYNYDIFGTGPGPGQRAEGEHLIAAGAPLSKTTRCYEPNR